jgi:16S rRNA (adenine1518-N6/adenine1519-N6)-dimethyltransferase
LIDMPRDISPQRQLGQNFVLDERILEREIDYADIAAEDTVLEIGAGFGNLTERLAVRAGNVIAVEFDRQFKNRLESLASIHGNISLIWGDARSVLLPPFNKVVANLPYRVALPIVFRLLDYPFGTAALLIQETMAQRICAGPGEAGYGRLSVTVQRLAHADLLDTVPRTAFSPAPDVDSAIVRLRPVAAPFSVAPAEAFRRLLDHLFLYRDDKLIFALQRLASAHAVALLLPKELRNRQVCQMTPAELGEVSRFLDSRKVDLPATSKAAKRKAGKPGLRPNAARRPVARRAR